MTATSFNPVVYKSTTRQQWQTAAKAWNDWGSTLDSWLGPATETMLDMAHVDRGARVLDVAAGAGGQSLLAARRTGSTGQVLATDISANILEYAAAAARAEDLSQIETKVIDGEELDTLEPGQLRCRNLAGRPDLFSRPAARAQGHMARAQARRTLRGRGLLDRAEQCVLFAAGIDNP